MTKFVFDIRWKKHLFAAMRVALLDNKEEVTMGLSREASLSIPGMHSFR